MTTYQFSLAAILLTPLWVCGAEPPAAPSLDPPAAPSLTRAETPARDPLWFACHVSVDLGSGATAHGSGTPIASEGGRTLVLTNAHVVPDGSRPITVAVAGKTHKASYVAGSRVTYTAPGLIDVDGPDLALVSVDADLGEVDIADEPPVIGAAVYQWGYATGRATMKSGVVVRGDIDALTTTIPVANGDSGSGIFDTNGQLVGVTWGGSATTVHYAVRVHTVRHFLRDRVRGLFPRLAARMGTRNAAPVATPPAAPKVDPPAAPKKTDPKPQTAPAPKECPPGKTCPAPQAPGVYMLPGSGSACGPAGCPTVSYGRRGLFRPFTR